MSAASETTGPEVRVPESESGRDRGKRARGARGLGARVGAPLGMLVALASFWQFAPGLLDIPSFVLPPLSDVMRALFDPSAFARYLDNAGVTLMEAGLGLAIGASLGLTVGILLSEVPVLHRMVYPYIIAIQSIPKVALAPLIVIWLGFGIASKIVVVILLTFFPMLVNTISGMKAAEQDYINLFLANNATRRQIRWKLKVPGALPSIMTGFEIAVVMSLLGAIVAEFVGAQAGLGVLILQAQYRMNTGAVFAILLILSAIGVTLNVLVRWLRRRVLFWMPGESND